MASLTPQIMLRSLWQVGTTVIVIALAVIALEAGLYYLLHKVLKYKYALPMLLLFPAAIGLTLLILYPISYEFRLAFSNMSLKRFQSYYTVTEQSLAALKNQNVPEDLLLKLRGIKNKEYPATEALAQDVDMVLGASLAETYRETITKQAKTTASIALPPETLQQLKQQHSDLPDDLLIKLEPVTQKSYAGDTQLLRDIRKQIGQEYFTTYQQTLLEHVVTTKVATLTGQTFFKLRQEGVPESVLAALEGVVDQQFTKTSLRAALQRSIGDDATAQYAETIFKHAEFSGPTFGVAEGLANLKTIFTEPVLKQIKFFRLLYQTILWTVVQVTCHVTLGLGLAMLLNRPLKLRALYRTLIVVPWALPPVVAALAWRGEFHYEFGFINVILTSIGFEGIQWKVSPFWNFVAMNITNIWLGVPFMAVILLGGLQSISQTYYEAASVDGATRWDEFRHITLPLIQPVMTPAVVLGVIWTFNNFNVPYFINEYELESSDILVTALFRAAFEYNRYGFAAAFALVIFLILLAFCVLYIKVVKVNLGISGSAK